MAEENNHLVRSIYKCTDKRSEGYGQPVMLYKLGGFEKHVPSYITINGALHSILDFDIINCRKQAQRLRDALEQEVDAVDDRVDIEGLAEGAQEPQTEPQQQEIENERERDAVQAAANVIGERLATLQLEEAQQQQQRVGEEDDGELNDWHQESLERTRRMERARLDRERHRTYGEQRMQRMIQEAQQEERELRDNIRQHIQRLQHLESLEEVRRAAENNNPILSARIEEERKRQHLEAERYKQLEKRGQYDYKNAAQMTMLERKLENSKHKIEKEKIQLRTNNLQAMKRELERTRELRFYKMLLNNSPVLLRMPNGRWKSQKKALIDKPFGMNKLREKDETTLARLAKGEIKATQEYTFVLLKKLEGVDTSMWSTRDILREFHDYKVRNRLCAGLTTDIEDSYKRVRAEEDRQILMRYCS